MSEEFIEFRFPCPECLVRAACQQKGRLPKAEKKLTEDDLYDAKDSACITVPSYNFDKKSYEKMFMECMANMNKRMMNSVGNNENDDGSNATTGVPMEYIRLFQIMSEAMQYIVNSTSWETGKLQKFDKDEINGKLKRIIWVLEG